MQKEVGPIEEQEERLLDALARVLVLIAKQLSSNDNENKHSGDNDKS